MRATEFILEFVDTTTARFKKWFDGSVVVDASGAPLTVFRGMGEKHSNDKNKNIIWVTPDIEYSHLYANTGEAPNIMPLYASVKNPFNLGFRSATTQVKLSDMANRIHRGIMTSFENGNISKSEGIKLIDAIRDLEDTSSNEFKPVWTWWDTIPEIKDFLKAAGYDAITAKEGSGDDVVTYGVFDASQLVSAITDNEQDGTL